MAFARGTRLSVFIASFLAAACPVAAATLLAEPPPSLAALKPAPKPVPRVLPGYRDAQGRHHGLSELRGRYVLLNLWATWCASCAREMPALAHLQGALPKNRFRVIALAMSDGKLGADDAIRVFLKAHGGQELGVAIGADVAFEPKLHVLGLPTTILLDRDGHEIARAQGAAAWDKPDAIAYFRKLSTMK